MIQRWQDAQLCQQLRVIVADAQAQGLDLLLKTNVRLDRRQCQVANSAGALHFAHQAILDHANAALAVTQFELNQTHGFSPVNAILQNNAAPCRSEPARDEVVTSDIDVD
ncbi:hypothetical protein D3C87_1569840 [compost metagenome]